METEYELNREASGEDSGRMPQVSGANTAVGFGRGCVPSDVRYVPLDRTPQISGANTAVAFGRGCVPSDVRYVVANTSEKTER